MPRVRLQILAILPILAMSCADPEGTNDPFNLPPDTFLDGAPSEFVFVDHVSFRWLGTDPDGDVVAFQYQLLATDEEWFMTGGVSGKLLASVDPPSDSPAELWSSPAPSSDHTFTTLPVGWLELRARSVDDVGLPDPSPAVHRFLVFYDYAAPVAVIQNDPLCGPLNGAQSYVFLINGSDEGPSGTTPRHWLEYRVQLRAQSAETCQTHLADPFTAWRRFPDDSDVPVLIGGIDPLYHDLFPVGCRWTFTLEVRDPYHNITAAVCVIEQNG